MAWELSMTKRAALTNGDQSLDANMEGESPRQASRLTADLPVGHRGRYALHASRDLNLDNLVACSLSRKPFTLHP